MTHLAPVTAIYISSHRDGWDLTDLVEAKSIHGALAIHLELGSKHRWAVTHVPSGRYIAARIESFSAAVVDESLTRACAIWRDTWTDNDPLAAHAKGFIDQKMAEAARRRATNVRP